MSFDISVKTQRILGNSDADLMQEHVGKACHLPFELMHKVYWAIQELNFDTRACGEGMLLEHNEMDELRLDAYANATIYKERTKLWHDKHTLERSFEPWLLYNSRLGLFPRTLMSRWSDPFL